MAKTPACCEDETCCACAHEAVEFEIRAYRRADYAALAAIWKAGEIVIDDTDSPRAIAENLKRSDGHFRIFVMEANRPLSPRSLACARARHSRSRRPSPTRGGGEIVGGVILTYDGRRAYVYHFAVHPEFRGVGLGRALLETCEEQAAIWGARHLRLIARTDAARVAAHKLYAQTGWTPDKNVWLYRKTLNAGVVLQHKDTKAQRHREKLK